METSAIILMVAVQGSILGILAYLIYKIINKRKL